MKIIVINICFIFVLSNNLMQGMYQVPRGRKKPIEIKTEPLKSTDLAQDVQQLIQKCIESFGPYMSQENQQRLANVLKK